MEADNLMPSGVNMTSQGSDGDSGSLFESTKEVRLFLGVYCGYTTSAQAYFDLTRPYIHERASDTRQSMQITSIFWVGVCPVIQVP
jgi:hypothetical protein